MKKKKNKKFLKKTTEFARALENLHLDEIELKIDGLDFCKLDWRPAE